MIKEYGMFTGAGEEMMNDFVKFVSRHSLSDATINKILWTIAENEEMYAEASDTVVREQVFAELNRGAW